ncbi:MAG: helix-turn-helix transcriptional regulator [Marinifilaceae bacterium]|nr:helix-turn-helix transcriptional regulator [Marinifilaceae bacterium]
MELLKLAELSVDATLTPREKEILSYIANGYLNKEIANKLNISVYTVINHRKNLTDKLGIKSIPDLINYANVNNLLDL